MYVKDAFWRLAEMKSTIKKRYKHTRSTPINGRANNVKTYIKLALYMEIDSILVSW